MVFGKKGSKDYSQVNLDDFSDDSSNGGDDFVENGIGIRTQQVRLMIWYDMMYRMNKSSSLFKRMELLCSPLSFAYIYIYIILFWLSCTSGTAAKARRGLGHFECFGGTYRANVHGNFGRVGTTKQNVGSDGNRSGRSGRKLGFSDSKNKGIYQNVGGRKELHGDREFDLDRPGSLLFDTVHMMMMMMMIRIVV
jgi:hypothetical protein